MENFQLCLAVCRIGLYTLYRRMCCKKPAPPRPEFAAICLGVGHCGKTTLLVALSGESPEEIVPTTGFSIKALQFKDCIMNVKEVGGGDKVRPFWQHYFRGSEAIIFMVDSSASEFDMTVTHEELEKVLTHKGLRGIPLLLVANCQDKSDARSIEEIKLSLDLDTLCSGRPWVMQGCSMQDIDSLREGFQKLSLLLLATLTPTTENTEASDNKNDNRL